MALNETLAELAALTVPQYITRANVDELLDRHQIQVQMTSGRWWSDQAQRADAAVET